MKLQEVVGNVVLPADAKVKVFRQKVSRQSFKLLYAGLYSQPIAAIIRELSTNAFDAHIAAGKADFPFEIHLPNNFERYFFIKDNGTGLSYEDIMSDDAIYTTFFDSDKVDSDDFTGCLGLGSKSPFAYTDLFFVESCYNGKKYIYNCFLNEGGEPSILQTGEFETDEDNGFKVQFAVEEKDFYEFNRKAEFVLSWFKVKPNVIGSDSFKLDTQEYLRKAERYGVVKNNRGHSNAVMGNVAYPFSSSDFYGLTQVEQKVLEWGVDLFLDMGDVEFVPSREHLSFTTKTKESIKKYLADAIKAIHDELLVRVQQQPTIWKARRMLHDIKHSILGSVRSMGKVEYNGKIIQEYVKVERKFDENNVVVGPQLEILNLKKERYKSRGDHMLYCDETPIYFDDLSSGGRSRITNNLHENGDERAYVFSTVSQEFLDETGIGEVIIRASTLPKPARKQREGTSGEKTYVKHSVLEEFNCRSSSTAFDYWHQSEASVKDGGVYVIISYGYVINGEQKIAPNDIKCKVRVIRAFNPDFKLYGIRPFHAYKLEKHSYKWIKLDDYLDQIVQQQKHWAEKVELLSEYRLVANVERYAPFYGMEFSEESYFGDFIKKLSIASDNTHKAEVEAFIKLNDWTKNPVVIKTTNVLAIMERSLKARYPLFPYLDWYFNTEFKDFVMDYIRMLDDKIFDLQVIKEAV